jgi:hypothetical protein
MIDRSDWVLRCPNRSRRRLTLVDKLRLKPYFNCTSTPDLSGRNSVVECQLPKLDVAGSTPVARSKLLRINWLLFSDTESVSLKAHVCRVPKPVRSTGSIPR